MGIPYTYVAWAHLLRWLWPGSTGSCFQGESGLGAAFRANPDWQLLSGRIRTGNYFQGGSGLGAIFKADPDWKLLPRRIRTCLDWEQLSGAACGAPRGTGELGPRECASCSAPAGQRLVSCGRMVGCSSGSSTSCGNVLGPSSPFAGQGLSTDT